MVNKKDKVEVGSDKDNNANRVARSKRVRSMLSQSGLAQNNPLVKSMLERFADAGDKLDAAMGDVAQAKAVLATAEDDEASAALGWNDAHAMAVTVVQDASGSASDILGAGFDVKPANAPKSPPDPPTGIVATYDKAEGTIDLHILFPTYQRCTIQISAGPLGPNMVWETLEGHGTKRSLSGYAPGTYYIRAANQRAKKNGAWFGPIAVVVGG